MKKKVVTFHSMVMGSQKTTYMVQVAQMLAEKKYKVLLIDGHIYHPGSLNHKITEILGVVLRYKKGQSLNELLRDHDVLRAAGIESSAKQGKKIVEKQSLIGIEVYCGFPMPDVVGRIIHLPEHSRIDVLLGSNPQDFAIKPVIDLDKMFEEQYGCDFFNYLKETLEKYYDYILINAPAGFSPLSGILCGQLADIFLAIDVDHPSYEDLPSYQVGLKLAEKICADGQDAIIVKSIKDNSIEQMVKLILSENTEQIPK